MAAPEVPDTAARSPRLPQRFKAVLHRRLPALYEFLRFRFGHPATMVRIAQIVTLQTGRKVMAGPFAGMICANAITGSYIPKILGCYELELHDIINEIIRRQPSLIVDIGCGEGYYAVGLALRVAATRVIGFDTDPLARAACADQARLNGVADRVDIQAFCDTGHLGQILQPRYLVICDCEGHEANVLRPDLVPALTDCDLLVELHEHLSPGVTADLSKRFAPTHDIQFLDAIPRDPDTFPVLQSLSPEHRRLAVAESRPDAMQWAWMQPKQRDGR